MLTVPLWIFDHRPFCLWWGFRHLGYLRGVFLILQLHSVALTQALLAIINGVQGWMDPVYLLLLLVLNGVVVWICCRFIVVIVE